MHDLRPGPRPAYRFRPAPKDSSGEVLKVAIMALLLVVILMAFYSKWQRDRSKAAWDARVEEQAALVESQSAMPDAPLTPPQTAPTYHAEVPTQRGPTGQQISTFNALQANCYNVARMNAGGEYPSLQKTACADYARFAYSIGVDPGELPGNRTPMPRVESAGRSYSSPSSATKVPPEECAWLERRKEQINAITRRGLSSQQTEYYRERLREINNRMWDINCRNH